MDTHWTGGQLRVGTWRGCGAAIGPRKQSQIRVKPALLVALCTGKHQGLEFRHAGVHLLFLLVLSLAEAVKILLQLLLEASAQFKDWTSWRTVWMSWAACCRS